jgi:tetratricopeptide (TPR) repeat protein
MAVQLLMDAATSSGMYFSATAVLQGRDVVGGLERDGFGEGERGPREYSPRHRVRAELSATPCDVESVILSCPAQAPPFAPAASTSQRRVAGCPTMSSSATPPSVPTRADVLEVERELEQAISARPQGPTRLAVALEQAVDACRRSPEAASGVFYLPELLGELAETYERLGRPDDALATMQAAIDAGYGGEPDPRCRLAEILLRAGRAEDAHPIFAAVKADTPDDVWLYNNAGLEYGAAGDHERAVAWLAEGLELAIATRDPERLVAQMSDLRRESLAALGRELDELEARADAFLAQPRPSTPARRPQELPDVLAARDAVTSSALAPTAALPPTTSRSGRVVLALSWFPREDFAAALEAWPQLADDWDTADHTEYNRHLQRHLSKAPTSRGSLWIAPIRIDHLRRWCSRTGEDPATGSARSSYAAELARTASDELIPWPPARNAPCWCGSGRKYKQCCGHPSVTAGPAVQ